MSPEKTKQLWDDFRNGSHSAFSQLYELYAADLYRYGYNLVRNKQLVEDCLHELFIHLYTKKSTLGDTDNIRFYLYRSIRRRLLDSLGKLRKFDSDEYFFDQAEFLIQPFESEWIAEQTHSRQQEMLAQELNKLPKRQKEILYLVYLKGLNYSQTAEIMDISLKTVYNTIHLALATMRKYLMRLYERDGVFWVLVSLWAGLE